MSATATIGILTAPTLRRVRREDVAKPAFSKPDGLELCLACWKDWMTGDQDNDLGMKTMQGVSGEDGTGPDRHEAQQEADQRIGAATDAMVNSLGRIHIWAIYRACSIANVWKFPNADLLDTIADAKAELTKKLKTNLCTSILF